MKPMEVIARDTTPDGEELILYRRDGVYHLRVNGLQLMSSRAHGSEDALARIACEAIAKRKAPQVLVGGLGFGYTLRAALDLLPKAARVVVCELFPCVLEWNRQGELGHLARHPLRDPRVTALCADIRDVLARPATFDAILLDVDNGPEAFTQRSNDQLYGPSGLERLRDRLSDGGVVAVWAADPDPRFERRMRQAGFEVRSETVSARGGKRGPMNTLFLGQLR